MKKKLKKRLKKKEKAVSDKVFSPNQKYAINR